MFFAPDTIWPAHLPLQQSPAYARMIAILGGFSEVCADPGTGQVLVVERRHPFGVFRMAARGPLWHSDDPDAQRSLLRQAKIHLLNDEATPEPVLRSCGYLPLMTPATRAILHLCADPLSQSTGKFRTAVRRGAKHKLNLLNRLYDPRRDHWIIQKDRAHQKAKGYRGYPSAWTTAFAQANHAQVRLLVAFQGKDTLAAMMFLHHETTATYHIGWTSEAGRAAQAHHQLLLRAAVDFHALGVKTLDLGTIDTVLAPGLARFKLSTGATAHTLGGTWLRAPTWRR